MNLRRYIPFLFMIVLSFSCNKNKKTRAEVDEQKILDYMASRGLNGTATGSGLYYVINVQGTGAQPTINSQVTVKYSGNLIDGTVFDASANAGATFGLSSVIKGWQEGIPLFKKGGKGFLLIPSALGYGNQQTGNIPPNSVLIFEIELLDVK